MTLPKTWNYLWEEPGVCQVCSASYDTQDELQQCHGCLETVHHHCLMEDWRAERLPICCGMWRNRFYRGSTSTITSTGG